MAQATNTSLIRLIIQKAIKQSPGNSYFLKPGAICQFEHLTHDQRVSQNNDSG